MLCIQELAAHGLFAEFVDRDAAFLDPLHATEVAHLGAVSQRRLEQFRAGRHCARRALARMGYGPGPLGADANGLPLWPGGVVGSIAHTGPVGGPQAVAVVARQRQVRALGVDLERRRSVTSGFAECVLAPSELARWGALNASAGSELALQLFCCKEAVFKAVFALAGTMPRFHQVELRLADAGPLTRIEVALTTELLAELEPRYGAVLTGLQGTLWEDRGAFCAVVATFA